MRWLSRSSTDSGEALPSRADHKFYLEDRLDGTGAWFLRMPEYETWSTSDSGVLLCYGQRKSFVDVVESDS